MSKGEMNANNHDEEIEDIMQMVRDLRDADYHVCPEAKWEADGCPEVDENGEVIGKWDVACSCNDFDQVIDRLRELKYNENWGCK